MPQALPTNKNKHKQKSNNNEVTKGNQNYHHSIAKQRENINNNRIQVGLDLAFHSLILWGWFSYIVEAGEVLNVDRALWVICFVDYTTGGTLKRGVDTSAPSMAGGDGAEVVICGMLLGIHSAGWFVCFA
jgi:hypothetical protein